MQAKKFTFAMVLLALALLGGGCGESRETSNANINARLQIDDAFVTVAQLQNTNALNYSRAILENTDSGEITAFANSVIKARDAEDKTLEKLAKNYLASGSPTPAEAAETLGSSVSELAISADGKPLAAPSGDAGYIKAMISNVKGSLVAIKADIDGGGPGTVPFAKEMLVERQNELEALEALQ